MDQTPFPCVFAQQPGRTRFAVGLHLDGLHPPATLIPGPANVILCHCGTASPIRGGCRGQARSL
jgi:hypothetical protein